MKTISAGLAGAVLLSFAGLAQAATQLVVPITSGEARLKSITELPVRFNREGVERLKAGAEVELALPNGSRHAYQYEYSISHGGGFTTWIARALGWGKSMPAR